MPRYDYKCIDCKTEFELRQTFAEAGKGVCPQCSGAGQRVFHAVPVIYKGSGFYTTDYGRPKRPTDNGANGSEGSKETSDSKSGAADSSSSDSKDSKSAATETASSPSGKGDSKSEPAGKSSSESKTSS